MTQVTVNGNTYSDDGTTPKDMKNRGHEDHFFPLVQDVMTEVAQVAADRIATAQSESNAAVSAQALIATSTTSIAIGTGSKTWTIGTGKQLPDNSWGKITRTGFADYMWGEITDYSGGDLTVNVQESSGSGTFSDWTIGLSGPRGAAGSNVPDKELSIKSANYTAVSADKGHVFKFTTSDTLSLTSAATLGAGWFCFLQNRSDGDLTVDPNGSEQIDSFATKIIPHGSALILLCDGTSFNTVLLSKDIGLQRHAVSTGNGEGSAKGYFRRFTTVVHNDGIDITYADSAANGASWTINETGMYILRYQEDGDVSPAVTRNQLGTASSLSSAPADLLAIMHQPFENKVTACGFAYLIAGDVINAHTNSLAINTTDNVYFEITRVW